MSRDARRAETGDAAPQPRRRGSSGRVLRNSRLGQSVRGRPPKREREILDAAIELFHERGYAQTSIEDVARAVGILKGSLYYYIDSKEDLLLRILEDVHEGVEAIIDRVAARSELSPLERLELYLREQVAFNAERINEIAVYHHEFSRLTGVRLSDIRRRRRRTDAWLVALLEEARQADELDAGVDPQLAAQCVFAPVVGMYTYFKPGGPISAPALSDFLVEFTLCGLGGVLRGANGSPAAGRARPRAPAH
jgi:AcrR family transcriptional regulator